MSNQILVTNPQEGEVDVEEKTLRPIIMMGETPEKDVDDDALRPVGSMTDMGEGYTPDQEEGKLREIIADFVTKM